MRSHSLRALHVNLASLLRTDLCPHSLRALHVNLASLLRTDMHSHSLRALQVNLASLLRPDMRSHSLRALQVNPASLLRTDLCPHSLRALHVNLASLLRTDMRSHSLRALQVNPATLLRTDLCPHSLRALHVNLAQPAQDRHALSLSSRPSTKLLRSSKLEPCSSLAKLVFQVLPKNKHDKVLAFDQLRSDVKSAKTGNTLSHINLQKYQTASTNLKQELLAQLKQNSKTILQYKSREGGGHSAYVKQLQHKNNILKRTLAHEWNTTST